MIEKNGNKSVISKKNWGSLHFVCDKTVFKNPKLSLAIVNIELQESNEMHRHPNCDEILYLLEGKLKHYIADEETVLEPGDCIYIRKNVVHYAENIGECDAKMLVCYNIKSRKTEYLE